ncbi:MAG: single-stranded DNA-binding protein [Candidatus Obscuribacterales bacterium]|nr:single-stranded DNA-binding protein [Candidatus Obscuribacterales bacterium]
MSLANISIVGNLVKDPEKVEFANGQTKTNMIVAVNGYDRSSKEKTAEYYKVETWDKLAELSKRYLIKGNQVTVTGRLTIDRWVDREGRQRATPTVHASQLALPPRPKTSASQLPLNESALQSTSEQFAGKVVDEAVEKEIEEEIQAEFEEDEEEELEENRACA